MKWLRDNLNLISSASEIGKLQIWHSLFLLLHKLCAAVPSLTPGPCFLCTWTSFGNITTLVFIIITGVSCAWFFSCFKSMGHFCSDHGYPCWSQLCYALFLWSYIASMPAVFASLDQWLNWPYPWAKHIIIWGASFGILVVCHEFHVLLLSKHTNSGGFGNL